MEKETKRENKHEKVEEKKKGIARKMAFVHPETVKYMRKHKQGMFSKEDKELVRKNKE